jgi:two-component system copper resistance phosphate regulon response regulator CusR
VREPTSDAESEGPRLRILCVEDDPLALQYLRTALSSRGFVVDTARRLREGLARAREGQHDALILDVSLPDGEGFELLRQLRGSGIETPVLFLSARDQISYRLRGFELGADDYLTKPFALAELVARTRAIVRRRGQPGLPEGLRAVDLHLDPGSTSVTRGGRSIVLPPRQYALLELLVEHYGEVVARDTIIARIWKGHVPRSNVLAVQISALRRAIDHGFRPRLIHTVSGVGYVIEDRRSAPPQRRRDV